MHCFVFEYEETSKCHIYSLSFNYDLISDITIDEQYTNVKRVII